MTVPTSIKRLKGTLQNCRMNKDEPMPDVVAALPTDPDLLDEVGMREYKHKSEALAKLGCFTEWDNTALCAYAALYQTWVKMEHQIAQEGLLTTSAKNRLMMNPVVSARNTIMSLMRDYLKEFGLTPNARTKIKADTSDKKADEWAAFGQTDESVRANVQ